jgi:hypothetical protein
MIDIPFKCSFITAAILTVLVLNLLPCASAHITVDCCTLSLPFDPFQPSTFFHLGGKVIAILTCYILFILVIFKPISPEN